MPASHQPTRFRAAVLGAALAILSFAGHTAAGGAVTVLGTALTLGLSCALAMAVSRTRFATPIVLLTLLGGEALLHLVLTFTSTHAHVAVAPTGPTMTAAHLVAAAVATLLVVHSDRLATAWRRFLSVVLGVRTPNSVLPANRATANPDFTTACLAPIAARARAHTRRGPPLLAPASLSA